METYDNKLSASALCIVRSPSGVSAPDSLAPPPEACNPSNVLCWSRRCGGIENGASSFQALEQIKIKSL